MANAFQTALDIQPFNLASPLEAASTITAGQQANELNAQLNPLKVQNAQQANDLSAQLNPIRVQDAQSELAAHTTANQAAALALTGEQQRSDLATTDYQHALIANSLSDLDPTSPDFAADVDDRLQTAAKKGAGAIATQWRGHINNAADLSKVMSIYSAPSPLAAQAAMGQGGLPPSAAVAQPSASDLDVRFQGMAVPQLRTAAQNLDRAKQVLLQVRQSANPAQTWDQLAPTVGHPELVGHYTPDAWNHLWSQTVPIEDYLQQRLGQQAAGVPGPVIPNKVVESGGRVISIDPTGTQANVLVGAPPTYEAASGAVDASGNPVIYDRSTGKMVSAGVSAGGSALDDFAGKMIGIENGTGNPGAKNPASSATGDGQFLKGTWLSLIKAQRPDLAQGKTDAQLLAMRSDPTLSRQMTAEYANENATKLQAAGEPVTYTTLALAHRFGPAGAQTILGANPSAQLTAILPKEVIDANPTLKGKTAGTYVASLAAQVGNTPVTNAADTANLTGDAFLKTMTPARASMIRAMADGDLAIPTGRAATSGPGLRQIQDVEQYDPTASAANLPSRSATRKSFTSGPYSQTINAANTVIGHLGNLSGAIDALGNTPLNWVNGPAQFVGQAVGNTNTQKAVADFNTYKTMVANELTKVYRGSNGAEADIQGWQKQLDSAASPVALHAVVNSMINGLDSRLEALGSTYSQGMGRAEDPISLLNPHAAQVLTQLRARADGNPAPGAAGNGPPAPAQRVVGQTYQSPKGPVKWTAQGWVLANAAQ